MRRARIAFGFVKASETGTCPMLTAMRRGTTIRPRCERKRFVTMTGSSMAPQFTHFVLWSLPLTGIKGPIPLVLHH
jgi:hypothetical protein